MADNPIKYGFRWSLAHNGGRNMPQPEEMIVATSQAFNINGGAQGVALGPGDPVTRLSTGGANLCDGSEGAGGGVALYGICVGVLPYYDVTFGYMRPAGLLPSAVAYGTNLERQSKILVVRAEAGVWEVDCDENSTATTLAAFQAFMGENCDHVLTGVVGATRALPRLDISTHATATSQWRIVGISKTAENQDYSGNYVKLYVTVNESQGPYFTATGV